jgi:type II secretory pathway component PulK
MKQAMPHRSLCDGAMRDGAAGLPLAPHSSSSRHSPVRPHPSSFRRPGRRRGTVLVTAIWATIAMTAIVLVLARTTKVELVSAGNRVSAIQAGAVERGAEQYLLSLCEAAAGDPTAVVDAPADTMIVGNGYFWFIKPFPDDETQLAYGAVDEASKLNVNEYARDDLAKLPGMLPEVADAIFDYRDTDSNITGQGAENDQPSGYRVKNDKFETVEELRLVNGMTDDLLFGLDLNHDGMLDDLERGGSGGTADMFNAANGAGRGIAPFVTVYSAETPASTGKANVNGQDPSAVVQALAAALSQSRASTIADQIARNRPFTSVFDFAAKTGMTVDELKQVYSKLDAVATTTGGGAGGGAATAAKVTYGKVNINTAPREVLMCLPGLEQADVDKLVSARTSAEAGDVSWVYGTLGPAKAAAIGAKLTDKSYQYSADIVALSGDGRSFKRVRVVVDARSTPAKIVFRKDLTDLGWPPYMEDLRAAVRRGEVLQTPFGSGGSSLGSEF